MDAYQKASEQWVGFPPRIVEKILAIEQELDEIWPKWRERARFDHVDYDLKCRIKWLLKRNSLLTGRLQDGTPDPKDWDVIVVRDNRNRGQCYAHPVLPVVESSEATREPPRPRGYEAASDPRHSISGLPTLAFKTKLPLEVIEKILLEKPSNFVGSNEDWVEVWKASQKLLQAPQAPQELEPAPKPAKKSKRAGKLAGASL